MSSGFSQKDLDSFFDLSGVGVATRIVLSTDPETVRMVNAIFTREGQEVSVYDSRIATDKPSILVKSTDAVGITERMQVTFPDLESHEDGYGETYQVTSDIIPEGVQATRVYLKRVSS